MNYETDLEKVWQNLTISNNYLFWHIMTANPDVCKEFIEILLDEKIEKIDFVQNESTLKADIDSRGIRLDVFAKNRNQSFDLEIQTCDRKDLPKRSRYYSSVMDVDSLKVGNVFNDLKDSYVMFICLFDCFGYGEPVYIFENTCRLKRSGEILKLEDRSYKIFYNVSNYDKMNMSDRQIKLFDFIKDGKSEDIFTEKLKKLVDDSKHNTQWRQGFMTWEMLKVYERQEARAEGHAEGHAEGLAEGRQVGLAEGRQAGLAEGLAEGRQEGHAEGLAEGRQEGAQQKALDATKKLIEMGLDFEKIALAEELPLETIQELAKEISHS